MARVLIFSFWSVYDGITQATVLPLITALRAHGDIKEVYLCTVEPRKSAPSSSLTEATHVPYFANPTSTRDKVLSLFAVPGFLKKVVRKANIDILWCKGAPAGGMGAIVNLLTGIPLVVDSLEPHSDYMLYSGTWHRWDPKFLIQRFLERETLRRAAALLPVSHQYAAQLAGQGVNPRQMFVLPCIVMLDQFAYQHEAGIRMRKRLNIDEKWTVGIYVGKYGGLYYDDEAFLLYQRLFKYVGEDFFLLLITETDAEIVRRKIERFKLPDNRICVCRLPHAQVPHALSAADFAISTIKAVEAMRYCSPIKHGEYWAADLPILSTLPIGDDAEIMKREGGGVIVDPHDEHAMSRIGEVLKEKAGRGSGRYVRLARKYRHPDQLPQAVDFVWKRLVTMRDGID